jgi:hypothetical protein
MVQIHANCRRRASLRHVVIEAKPSDYPAHDRPELVPDVPRPIEGVLARAPR